jgi:hypothetical protein
MKIHNANATAFDTKQDCQDWIDSRVVRFKLRVHHGKDKDGNFIVGAMQKSDGKIIDKTADGFKPQAYDEPLTYYAEPVSEDDKWLAVMKVSDQ